NIENYDDNYSINVNDINDIAMDIDNIEIDFNSVISLITCLTSNQSISEAT
ncbi:28715_t:CDS:1, partial [Gigaspora margarita]